MYIDQQFQQFFIKYLSTTSTILSLIDNEEQFQSLRKKLLEEPTIQQILVDKSAATVDHIIHHQQQDQNTNEEAMNKEKCNQFKNKIFIHCVHESRLRGLAREIHEIHDSFFKNTIYQEIRLIVGHRNNPNLEFELTRKRPSTSLLKNQPLEKSKFFSRFYIFIVIKVSLCFFFEFNLEQKVKESTTTT
jgi:hypothetical protein